VARLVGDERDRERARPAGAKPAAAGRGRDRDAAHGDVARLASAVGNAQFARLVAPGSGIMPGGTVHPSVERLISDRAGRGARLDSGMASWASEQLGPAMPAVSIHTDATADALARSVSARAFTVRNDVFFSAGAYQPHSGDGRRLVAHELTHVAQQQGAASGGPLRVSDPGDALERDAERIAGDIDG
jgi:hypothetical protein